MKKIFSKEILIGTLVLIALALLFFGIDFLKGVNLFHSANYYYVSYGNVEGLAISAPVTVNGFKVGQVREIEYEYDNPGHVRVELSLDAKMKLPKGTQALFTTDLLGTSSIALSLGEGTDYYTAGATLPAAEPKGLMSSVSEEIVPSVAQLMPKVDSLLSTIITLAGDPALLQSIRRLDAITANLEHTTARLNTTVSGLPAVATDVKTITGNFANTSQTLDSFATRVNALPVDSLMAQLQTTVANLNELTNQLNSADSSLGKLTHDPALYNNLNATVQSLDSLFIDIKKNPKRYISIKLL